MTTPHRPMLGPETLAALNFMTREYDRDREIIRMTERGQASDSTMDELSDRADALRAKLHSNVIPPEFTIAGVDEQRRKAYEAMSTDPDNYEAASLCWVLGDVVVLEGNQWISLVDQMPVQTELVHQYGRVLRVDPTVTPADVYDAEAIHPK